MTNEDVIRFLAFISVLGAMAAWEIVAPRRTQRLGRGVRWPSNLGIVVLDTVLVRLLFPATAVGLALVCETGGWGLLHVLGLPLWASVPLGFLAMDMAIYLQHVMFHAVPGTLASCTGCTMPIRSSMSRPACASTPSRYCCRWASSSA